LIARFLFLWLCTGFAMGSLTLLGPVRWYASLCRHQGWPVATERAGVGGLMLILIVITAAVAWRLARLSQEAKAKSIRAGVPALAMLAALAAYWIWVHPSWLSGSMGAEDSTAQFTFGPYPTESRMQRLKQEHFTIISLLSPAVLPFEPQLMAEEDQLAKKIGVPVLHVPMLPWVSGNREALQRIRELARDKSRRYYVHCYLGKDRVQIVRRLVEKETGGTGLASYTKPRALSSSMRFERGQVYRLGDEGFLIPCPTDEELVGYVLAGDIRSVAALLNPDNPDDRLLIDHERQILAEQGITFLLIPSKGSPDAARILQAVEEVQKLPQPFAVHAFFTPESGRAEWAQAFLEAYRLRKAR